MNVVHLKGTRAPKNARSIMDTMIITQESIKNWQVPAFQRMKKVNNKVITLAEHLRNEGGVIPGVITIGIISGNDYYIVDGQHRLEAFKLSELKEAIVDVRLCHFDNFGDMAEEFVNLNSALVKMGPDDILRGLEPSSKVLQKIRKACPFVGYDNVRRGTNSPVVSMASAIRSWHASASDTPAAGGSMMNALQSITDESAEHLIQFLLCAHAAWGRDIQNRRLWGNLNLALTMWIFRRIVHGDISKTNRYVKISLDQFKKCLMALSADGDYVDWLVGRLFGERDRASAYQRIKTIFAKRIGSDTGKQRQLVGMPKAEWSY